MNYHEHKDDFGEELALLAEMNFASDTDDLKRQAFDNVMKRDWPATDEEIERNEMDKRNEDYTDPEQS